MVGIPPHVHADDTAPKLMVIAMNFGDNDRWLLGLQEDSVTTQIRGTPRRTGITGLIPSSTGPGGG